MSELPPPGPPQDPISAPPNAAQPPPQNPYQPYAPGYGPGGVPQWAPDHPDATTVLLLGILGLAICQAISPFAWIKGSKVKKEIQASGGQYGGLGQVQIGYVLGIVGTAILAFSALAVVGAIVFIIIAAATSTST